MRKGAGATQSKAPRFIIQVTGWKCWSAWDPSSTSRDYLSVTINNSSSGKGSFARLCTLVFIRLVAKYLPFPLSISCHSHVIKRFDTNAVSATSLFRAAFPTASEDEEAIEMAWIAKGSKQQYGDTRVAGVEHSELRKLSGIWCVYRFAFERRQRGFEEPRERSQVRSVADFASFSPVCCTGSLPFTLTRLLESTVSPSSLPS